MFKAGGSTSNLTYPRLATIVASRIALNAIFRVAYPLIPFVVAHFGVGERTATWLVTIQVLAGLTSPLGGWLGDRYGHREIMLLGLGIVLLGVCGVAAAPNVATIIAALALVGLGTATFQPSMQAYVSDLTPYARRGRALGIVELSWSLAGILAVSPLVALAEWSGGLHLPFAVLALLILAVLSLSFVALPPEHQAGHKQRAQAVPLRTVLAQPSFGALALFLWLAVFGQEVLFIAQAPWLGQHFGATPQRIGNTLFVFGIGELVGVSLATAFTDRLGKLRSPMLGFAGAALVYAALPVFGRSWSGYLLLFGLFGLLFEFAIVSSFSLASSINPRARGKVMAGSNLATQTGRAAGSWAGIRVWEGSNIVVNGAVAAALTAIAVVIAGLAIKPQESIQEPVTSEPVSIL